MLNLLNFQFQILLQEFDRQLAIFNLTGDARRTPRGCLIWPGEVKGYSYARFSFPGQQKRRYTRHTLIKVISIGLFEVPEGLEGSHLCSNKLCLNPDHVVLESHAINKERQECSNKGFCDPNFGHIPRCLLP